jgi:hypothetical protein
MVHFVLRRKAGFKMKNNWSWITLGILALSAIFCGQTPTQRQTDATEPPPPTATSVPTPLPPVSTPEDLPDDSNLRELVLYANTLNPLLIQAGEVVQRDGEILKEAEGGNDAALCDGRLEGDNLTMKTIVDTIRTLTPPSDATAIHNLLLESGDAWIEMLDNVELFCDTGNQLYKIPAVLKFWEAAAKLQDAGNRFWLLILAEGVEDWVQR